ncbi:unnamed protein product, partial [marine sediment metagenome]
YEQTEANAQKRCKTKIKTLETELEVCKLEIRLLGGGK